MPTPVSAARQCLAHEAAAALDEAVAVARRRTHAQTTSLHVVSALLSLPSSSSSLLRDALSRAPSPPSSFPPRLHFKALELCFFVALDRLPTSSGSIDDEPPVSNSLMAAIKRSQANQRRNPETFHLYQHQQQSTAFAGVKVELQQLVLSILDDPVVSRVFADAGFRSCDVKLGVLRPPPASIFSRFPARCPPLFLCSFSDAALPFPSDASGENCRRIGEILVRQRARNPLLVGAGAAGALGDFESLVEGGRWGALPGELSGIRLARVQIGEQGWEGRVRAEAGTRGVVVSVGDLGAFVDSAGVDSAAGGDSGAGIAVGEVTRLLGEGAGRVWVVGCSASYEIYMKFLARYPNVDKEWDLQLLPITSLKVGSPCNANKGTSLMDSFVPFGGFFPVASTSFHSSKFHQQPSRCQQCNEKYDQEVALLKENFEMARKANLPSWMWNTEPSPDDSDWLKAKDGRTILNEKISILQKKWNSLCQRLHCDDSTFASDEYGSGHEAFPRIMGFPIVTDNNSIMNCNNGTGLVRSFSERKFPVGLGMENILPAKPRLTVSVVSQLSNTNALYDQKGQLSKEEMNDDSLRSRSSSHSDLVAHIDLTSPSSAVSVSTDLVLGSSPISLFKQRGPSSQASMPWLGGVAQCIPFQKVSLAIEDVPASVTQSTLNHSWPGSPRMNSTLSMTDTWISLDSNASGSIIDEHCLKSSNISLRFDFKDFKALYRDLIEKVHWQEQAICEISEIITRCRTENGRRHGIWLSFIGPDKMGKRRVAAALAELLFGDKRKLIHVDLGLHGESMKSCVCDDLGSTQNGNFRGKVIVDHIFMEINKKPRSVVFLENVDKADVLVQASLSHAIKMGRFQDSHGRELGVSNSIFITTVKEPNDNTISSGNASASFCEERILSAQKWQLEILIESSCSHLSLYSKSPPSSLSCRAPFSPCSLYIKRKIHGDCDVVEPWKSSESLKRAHKELGTVFDLNVPFEETCATDNSSMESSSLSSENSLLWLEEFFGLVDKTIVFKPFDFEALADYITKEITECFQNSAGSGCQLVVDSKAMEQMLAATWLLDDMRVLTNWLQQVLATGFTEAGKRYNLSCNTVLRLAACEGSPMEEQALGICLPSRVIVN